MSETAKVRLVRCPKCENLLPEVADFSVYQCGGCGAVLRAKNKGVDLDSFSQKSDEDRVGNAVETLSDRYEKMSVSEKRLMENTDDGSESDVRSNISSSSRAERRRILRDRAQIYRSNLLMNKEVDEIQDEISNQFEQSKISEEDLTIPNENENGLWNSGQLMENGEKSEIDNFRMARRMDAEVSIYGKEEPSDLLSRSSYDYGISSTNKINDIDEFLNAGGDRAEILKRLDELKDQISKSGNLIDKGKGTVPFDRRMPRDDPYAFDNHYSDPSLGTKLNREPLPYSYSDAQFRRSPYYPEPPPPLIRRQEMTGNGFYPPDHVQEYGDPLRSRFPRRGPHQTPPPPYHQPPSRGYMSGPYMDEGMGYMDTMESYPPNVSRHHPSCSCFQCHNKRQVPPSFHPTDVPKYNYHDNYSSFGLRDYSHNSSIRSHNYPQSHARWPSNVNSEFDGFTTRRRPPGMLLPSGGQRCRPIAGGAPFLACCNCFELLLLPKKVLLSKNKNRRRKIICGACSTVIVFAVSSGKLVVYADVEEKGISINVNRMMPAINDDGLLNQTGTTFASDDFDDSGYDFHSMDREIGQLSNGHGSVENRRPKSTFASEVEEDRESPIPARKDSGMADQSTKGKKPPAGSSLQEYFEYSNIYRQADRNGDGNRSERSDYDDLLPKKAAATPPNLRKDSVATEIDLSSNEFGNTGTTYDSGEASRDSDNLKRSRAAESFFGSILKKSINKDSSKSNQSGEQEVANVTVNGHLIPDRLVKKAERLAGPISPGHYWYDFRAGFWGAVGTPCLGIIPPFIEEFNYPLPEHCAAGNTQVLVNGRELNQKDLNLLVSRGLPSERDRSYIIEISGRVLDEDTGEELESLGKLAPTVEKNKRGFGMRAPKVVA